MTKQEHGLLHNLVKSLGYSIIIKVIKNQDVYLNHKEYCKIFIENRYYIAQVHLKSSHSSPDLPDRRVKQLSKTDQS